jgi:hypothetical protein
LKREFYNPEKNRRVRKEKRRKKGVKRKKGVTSTDHRKWEKEGKKGSGRKKGVTTTDHRKWEKVGVCPWKWNLGESRVETEWSYCPAILLRNCHEFGKRTAFGNGKIVLKQAMNMEFYRLVHVFFGFFSCQTGGNASGQIR